MRLNPATKNEPDYRLFVIHMLVNLRRLGEHLNSVMMDDFHCPVTVFSPDDHSVRDSERKAAIHHFDTDQV